MSRGIHFVTTHVAIFMATCMFSLGALGAWQPKTKKDLVDAIGGSGCPTSRIVGPADEPISEWDVSRVTDMSYLFKDCSTFNEDISKWETSRVTTFKRMFEDAAKFNVDISSWKTKRAQTFEHMFEDAAIFNADISSWNTASSQTFYYMFGGATTFNQPLGSWNTGTATNFFAMFYGATAFNQPLGSWNTAKAWTFQNMFHQATAFNQPLDSWNTAKATYFRYMFEGATAFNQPLGSWNTGKVTDFHDIFSGTSVDIDTTAYWDTTNTGSELFKLLSPQQPCPAGYNASQTYPIGTGAQYGTLARRCPDGCNLAGYGEDVNGFCAECVPNNDRYYNNGGSCTTAECDNAGSTEYYDISAVYTDNVCSVATCAKGTKPAADQLSCDSCATVSGRYYTTAGDCTITQNCPSLGDNEEYVTGVVLTSPTGCKKCSSPGIGQKFISPSPSPGKCATECIDGYALTDNVCTKPENPEEKKTKSEAEDNNGTIIGIIIGAVVLLIILAIVLWWFCCYRRRKRSDLPKANVVMLEDGAQANVRMLQDEVPDADFNVTAAMDVSEPTGESLPDYAEMTLPNYSEKGI